MASRMTVRGAVKRSAVTDQRESDVGTTLATRNSVFTSDTIVVVVPVLCAGLALAPRWWTARLVWAGALAYNVYNYAYFVVGTRFNDLFLAHILVLSLSAWGLVFLLVDLATGSHVPVALPARLARPVAALFGLVAAVLGGMWSIAILRQTFTGALPAGAAPPAGLHTVFAVDLSFFVSSLFVATVLVWRRGFWGAVAGTVMSTAAALYLLNLMAAQWFQFRAGVDGVAAFSPVSAVLFVLFAGASALVLRSVATQERASA